MNNAQLNHIGGSVKSRNQKDRQATFYGIAYYCSEWIEYRINQFIKMGWNDTAQTWIDDLTRAD